MNFLQLHLALVVLTLLAGITSLMSDADNRTLKNSANVITVLASIALLSGYMSIRPEPDALTILGGLFAVYLMISGWLPTKHRYQHLILVEAVLIIASAIIGVYAFYYGLLAFLLEAQGSSEIDASLYFIIGTAAIFAMIADMRWQTMPQTSERSRTARHLWRTFTSLMATVAIVLINHGYARHIQL